MFGALGAFPRSRYQQVMTEEAQDIPRKSADDLQSTQFVTRYLGPGLPVILTGLAKRWPAASTWTLEHLVSRFGDRVVSGMAWEGEGVENSLRYTWISDRLDAWASGMLAPKASRQHGFVATPLPQVSPELMAETGRLDAYMPTHAIARRLGMKPRPPELWLNQAGTVSPMHFSVSHNLLAQMSGTKTITLFAPSDGARLGYPSRDVRDLGPSAVTFTALDPDAPDSVRFPRFREATPMRVTIVPGEVLFIPSGYFQLTRFPETSVSLSYFWTTPKNLLKNAPVLASSAWRRFVDPILAG